MRFITYNKATGKITADLTANEPRALAAYPNAARGIILITPAVDLTDKVVDLNTGEIVDRPDLVAAKAQEAVVSGKSAAEADLNQILDGYVTTPHGAFSLAPGALSRLTGALLAAVVDPGRFVDWRLEDGTVIPLGYADLVIIHTAAMDTIAGASVAAQAAIDAL